MEQINKAIRYNELLQIYGSLLSTAQQEILNDYYGYDLSISEIAENRNSSRAAVEDAIKKGSNKLESFEKELKVLEKRNDVLANLDKLKESSSDSQKEIINEIERILK